MNKRFRNFAVALLMVFGLIMVPIVTHSAEKIIDLEVTSVTNAIDRNGNAYTRLIVSEQKELHGVAYKLGVPAMGFGEVHNAVKDMKAGGRLKAVVQERSFQGRNSYTILTLIE
jgi:hypothetical protein